MPIKTIFPSFAAILLLSLACNLSRPIDPTQTNPPSSLPGPPQIITSINYEYYTIKGVTKDQLNSEMKQGGPVDDHGNHYFGWTIWHVSWSYTYSQINNTCSTGPVDVSVEITYYLPSWNPPSSAPLSLIIEWAAFYGALELHEQGHRDIGAQAGEAVLDALESLGSYSSCTKLEEEADALGEEILTRFREIEISYDTETNHGETQGVKFP